MSQEFQRAFQTQTKNENNPDKNNPVTKLRIKTSKEKRNQHNMPMLSPVNDPCRRHWSCIAVYAS